jgi:hypothetical protein
MTTRALVRLTTIAAAVVLGAATLGCGFLSNIGNAVDNIQEVADLTDLMTKSADLTYTGEYTLVDGSGSATVVQQPPNAAFIGKDGRFILTDESLYMCEGTGAKTTCQRTPNSGGAAPSADQAAYMTAVAGAGFISTPMAIALMGTAAIVPGVEIEKSTKTVAGLESTCLDATKISATKPAGDTSVDLSEVTVCVADNGVLTVFRGTGTDGSQVGVELKKFSTTVDAAAFAPPKGAKVVDVGQLNP